MVKIVKGWLESSPGETTPIIKIPTSRVHRLGSGTPKGIVWHTTDDPPTRTYCRDLATRWSQPPSVGEKMKSVHVLIDRPYGAIYQLAPFDVGCHHTQGLIDGAAINEQTVGVELANAGRVKLVEGRWYAWSPGWQAKPDRLVTDGIKKSKAGGYWQEFTPQQLMAAKLVFAALRQEWPEIRSYYHGDLDPVHREDPGPFFPRGQFI